MFKAGMPDPLVSSATKVYLWEPTNSRDAKFDADGAVRGRNSPNREEISNEG